MPSGSTKKFHVFGDQWASFTMMFHLNQSLSATSSPDFWVFGMTLEWRLSQSSPSFYGIDEMLAILGSLFIHSTSYAI